MVRRTGPTAFPPAYADEDDHHNEARYRAEVEKAFGILNLNDEELNRRLTEVEDFGGGANLFYNITDDAGDGTVEGDAVFTDFSGQTGAVDQCASNPEGVVVYYRHKGEVYFWTGPRPSLVGLCSQAIDPVLPEYFTPFGGLVDWDDITNKPSTFPPDPHTHPLDQVPGPISGAQPWWRISDAWTVATYDALTGKPATFPPSPHTHVEADITDLDRVRWLNVWVQQEYVANDMVRDGDWLMIANKTTTDRAAPQPEGTPQYDLPDVPVWTTQDHTGVVRSGREWDITVPVEISGYQVWVPTLTDDTNYVILVYVYPTGQPDQIEAIQIAEPILVEGQWSTISTEKVILASGQTLGIAIDALNSGSSTTITGGWTRAANANGTGTNPGTGAWGTRNNEANLRINYVDLDGTDRTSELNGIVPGSSITFASTANPSQSMTWTINGAGVDNGTHISFANVTYEGQGSGGEPGVGTICTVTADVPVPSPTDYVVELGGNPSVNTRGTLEFDGVPQTGVEGNAYGVRILFDEYILSPDWDIAGYVGLGGGGTGGGGGGVTQFTNLSDTPDSYAGQAGKSAVVNQGEDALEFTTPQSTTTGPTLPATPSNGDQHYLTVEPVGLYVFYEDPDSSQWVQTNGGAITGKYAAVEFSRATDQSFVNVATNAQFPIEWDSPTEFGDGFITFDNISTATFTKSGVYRVNYNFRLASDNIDGVRHRHSLSVQFTPGNFAQSDMYVRNLTGTASNNNIASVSGDGIVRAAAGDTLWLRVTLRREDGTNVDARMLVAGSSLRIERMSD